jgi:membrane protease YdiL (CAAX protease family)
MQTELRAQFTQPLEQQSAQKATFAKPALWALMLRTVLFFGMQCLIVLFFSLQGEASPWQKSVAWWPFQVTMANVLTFLWLRWRGRKEGFSFKELINFDSSRIGKDLLLVLLFLLLGFVGGALGLYGLSYLMYGSLPPDTMFQALPMWAAIGALVLFPLSNGLVELPTYFAYAMPRLEAGLKNKVLAFSLAALALAFQHFVIPVTDLKFMIWHALSFIPLAVIVGLAYRKTKRMFPLMIAHGLMDLQMAVTILMVSMQVTA